MGGLFAPEAYITATRQTVAQSNQWSLEELRMHIEVGTIDDRPDTFKVEGIALFLYFNCRISVLRYIFEKFHYLFC